MHPTLRPQTLTRLLDQGHINIILFQWQQQRHWQWQWWLLISSRHRQTSTEETGMETKRQPWRGPSSAFVKSVAVIDNLRGSCQRRWEECEKWKGHLRPNSRQSFHPGTARLPIRLVDASLKIHNIVNELGREPRILLSYDHASDTRKCQCQPKPGICLQPLKNTGTSSWCPLRNLLLPLAAKNVGSAQASSRSTTRSLEPGWTPTGTHPCLKLSSGNIMMAHLALLTCCRRMPMCGPPGTENPPELDRGNAQSSSQPWY